MNTMPARIEYEASRLRELGATLVVADLPPLGSRDERLAMKGKSWTTGMVANPPHIGNRSASVVSR